MQWKVIDEEAIGRRTFAIVFETGDEVMAGLQQFLKERPVGAS